jgi:hypothetical protein
MSADAVPEESDPLGERLRSAARSAVDDVDSLGVSSADRPVVLGLILACRLGLTTSVPSATPFEKPDQPGTSAPPLKAVESVPDGDLVSKIAATLKIDREVAEMVYDVKDGELGYVISARRLASDKAGATRQLATIVAAGRQCAGLEEWTSVGVVREAVNDYGKLDSANFASYVGKLDKDNAFLLRGKGANREIKITRSGLEPIAELLTSLTSS